ncbi:unnamed protein product [Cuscuta epithymum]|uniref:Uncharacterized protein n=1 Tax=Cuscuta epithymum TaxID=186058 RepID=A0AAV0C0Q3_9ASTE|nr:unnamed protein product [Cuscuta epithymum]
MDQNCLLPDLNAYFPRTLIGAGCSGGRRRPLALCLALGVAVSGGHRFSPVSFIPIKQLRLPVFPHRHTHHLHRTIHHHLICLQLVRRSEVVEGPVFGNRDGLLCFLIGVSVAEGVVRFWERSEMDERRRRVRPEHGDGAVSVFFFHGGGAHGGGL